MALSQLASFPLVDTTGAAAGSMSGNALWVPYRGIMANINSALCCIAVDGVFTPIWTSNGSIAGWSVDDNGAIGYESDFSLSTGHTDVYKYFYDNYAFVGQRRTFVGNWSGGGFWAPTPQFVQRGGKQYWVDNNPFKLYSQDKDTLEYFVAPTLEYTSPEGVVMNCVQQGRFSTEIALTNSNRLYFFDLLTMHVVKKCYLPASFSSIMYVPELGIIAALNYSSKTITLFSLEVEPVSVSTPILISGTLTENSLCTFRVQVLGAQSEPAVGEIVLWTATGAGATMMQDQSVVDAQGYATAQVFLGTGSSGISLGVEATVPC